MKKVITSSSQETQKIASEFAKTVKKGDILCFYGNLGSGKTTFIQGFSKGLGIKNRIISPTFIILRSYTTDELNFYHVDLYRTITIGDLNSVGLDEIINSKDNIVAIEWAEKLGKFLPEKRIDIKFNILGNDKREITFERYE